MIPSGLNKLNKWHCFHSWHFHFLFCSYDPWCPLPVSWHLLELQVQEPDILFQKSYHQSQMPFVTFFTLNIQQSYYFFDHFSALTIIFTLLSTLFPNESFSGSTVYRRDVFLTWRKNYLGPGLTTDNCPQTLKSCLLMHPVSSVTCSLSSTAKQCWLICSQVTSGRGHEAKNSLQKHSNFLQTP